MLLFLVNGTHKKPCLADKLLDVKLATVPGACLMEGCVDVCEMNGEEMRNAFTHSWC